MSAATTGFQFSSRTTPLVRHMDSIGAHRETLRSLQGSWDTLALLGHLSNLRADIGDTREAFDHLAHRLMNALADETLDRALSTLGYKAQVAIDILTRNLFERTADIGFLATDSKVVDGCGDAAGLELRFRDYVQRYSVYADAMLLGLNGQVLCRLKPGFLGETSSDLCRNAIASSSYVEAYGVTDLTGPAPALTYASAMRNAAGSVAGVLVLVFDLVGESSVILGGLRQGDELLAIVDGRRRVVQSSDPQLLPTGYVMPKPGAAPLMRIGGAAYLAVQRGATPYQGYNGPGWTAVALVPIDVAFTPTTAAEPVTFTGEGIFSESLSSIPVEAAGIQRRLDLVVWNGQLQQGEDNTSNFSRALLREIAATGNRTKGVFESAVDELLSTVAAAALAEAGMLSGLAVDILDRNLFERACDCRWWAKDATLMGMDASKSAGVLRHINALYTVYTDIVLFDMQGAVVASSAGTLPAGTQIDGTWVASCLKVREPLGYVVSTFERSSLYGDRPTYVYSCPVRVDGEAVGGVAIVFDAEPQFKAMLESALPKRAGAVAAFVRPDGAILSKTGELAVPLGEEILGLRLGEAWSGVVTVEGRCFAVAATANWGYREFKTSDGYRETVIGVVVVPCGSVRADIGARQQSIRSVAGGQEIATFSIGDQLVGAPGHQVVECIEIDRSVRVGQGDAVTRHRGFTPWRDGMLPLIDLSCRLGTHGCNGRQAVVMAHEGRHFGLLIDELGPIVNLEVSASPVPSRLTGGMRLVGHIAHSAGVLVPLLSPDSVATLIAVESA